MPSTLYFNNAVDTAWDTLGNWWLDAAFTVPAPAIPANGDTVFIGDPTDAAAGVLTSPPSILVTLVKINVVGPNSNAGCYVSADFSATVAGPWEFSGAAAYNSGTITGDCTFSGAGALNNNGIITGDCTFSGNNASNDNGSTVYGACIFSGDNTFNNGAVYGPCTFSGIVSINYGFVSGDCTFSGDSSGNDVGDITGNCTFSGSDAFNNSHIAGSATFTTVGSIKRTAGAGTSYISGVISLPFADILGTGLL